MGLRHADAGDVEHGRYDWVVGCDGSKSRVRQEAGIGFTGQRVGVMAMMDVEIEAFPYDGSWVNYFISRDLFMLVTRLPGRYWRVYLSDAGAMTEAGNPRQSFQQVADQMGIGMKIGEPQWATQWEILNNIAARYREGRVLLCGDASHVHSPAGGQGMNGCMQDAFNLGWKLAAVVNGFAEPRILDTYERERRPIGEQITAGRESDARHRDGIRHRAGGPDQDHPAAGMAGQRGSPHIGARAQLPGRGPDAARAWPRCPGPHPASGPPTRY